jgi:hypothetical protein
VGFACDLAAFSPMNLNCSVPVNFAGALGLHRTGIFHAEALGKLDATLADCGSGEAMALGDGDHRISLIGDAGGQRQAFDCERWVSVHDQLADQLLDDFTNSQIRFGDALLGIGLRDLVEALGGALIARIA